MATLHRRIDANRYVKKNEIVYLRTDQTRETRPLQSGGGQKSIFQRKRRVDLSYSIP